MSFSEHFYQSLDGLNLYYREYAGENNRLPLLCLSGLTRNSADFDDFAIRYSGVRKVYALDYRGRGKSDYDSDYQNYNPQTYIGDIFAFLTQLKIAKVILVGTSLGGLLAMGFAGLAPQYVDAVLLNDIGPEINSAGGDRIADYVGKENRYASLAVAVADQKRLYSGAYPDLEDDTWLKTTSAGLLYDEKMGIFRSNYDLSLGKALREQGASGDDIDLWALFENLRDIPTLAIRGALSDVLSADVFDKMQRLHPDMQALTLENRGHVPLLNEPLALKIMDPFFNHV